MRKKIIRCCNPHLWIRGFYSSCRALGHIQVDGLSEHGIYLKKTSDHQFMFFSADMPDDVLTILPVVPGLQRVYLTNLSK